MSVSSMSGWPASSLRNAGRALVRSPGFTIAATLTLAMGLAAATVMFSAINAVLLRPLPFREPDQILCVTHTIPFFGQGRQPVTLHEYLEWRSTGMFTHLAALDTATFTLLGAGAAEHVAGVRVTADFFPVFGMQAAVGRVFRPDENAPEAKPTVILSHDLWVRKFNSDANVIGKPIRLGDHLRIVIGVMPQRFEFPRHADIATAMDWAPERTEFWIPLQFTQQEVQEENFNFLVLGRLAPGVSRSNAQQSLQAITRRILQQMAQAHPQFGDLIRIELPRVTVDLESLQEVMTSNVRSTMLILLAAVALLVLLVYANAASLFLTRSAIRMREFAIRQALGASDWQIFRQMLWESGVFAAIAAGLALLFSAWAIEAIRAIGAGRLPRLYELTLDYRVVLCLVLLAVFACVLFGAVPWLVRSRIHFAARLQEQGRTTAGGRTEQRVRHWLVVGELALTMVLLVTAALLVESLHRVFTIDPGFDPSHLVTASIASDSNRFTEQPRRYQHFEQLLAAVRRLPEVESASMVSALPLTGEIDIHTVSPVGAGTIGETAVHAESRVVDPDYVQTMRIPLVRGRWFRPGEAENAAVISENLARRFWPGSDPIGREFRDGDNPPLTVIGTVEAVRNASLERESTFQYYRPAEIEAPRQMLFVIRSRTEAEAVISAARQAIQHVDPEQPLAHTRTMDQILGATTLPRRFETLLLSSFAAIALFLSCLGVFSVLSLLVTQRTREFGIRMALGATVHKVTRLVLHEAFMLLAVACASGITLSLLVERFLRSLLFGTRANDLLAYAVTVSILAACCSLACWIPAHRAGRIDPAHVLRNE